MTRWIRPPELGRDRDAFDPIVECARYRLSEEIAQAIWQRACAEATDRAGHCDLDEARRRLPQLAARVAADGGRLRPDVGRLTRVEVELGGVGAGADPLAPRVPGRDTLVAAQARQRTQHTTSASAAERGPDAASLGRPAFGQRDLPGADEAKRALAALFSSSTPRAAVRDTAASITPLAHPGPSDAKAARSTPFSPPAHRAASDPAATFARHPGRAFAAVDPWSLSIQPFAPSQAAASALALVCAYRRSP